MESVDCTGEEGKLEDLLGKPAETEHNDDDDDINSEDEVRNR